MNYQNYIDEHKELYLKLEYFLNEFTKLKNHRDDDFLFMISEYFYVYIEELLDNHFKEEEQVLFPFLEGRVEAEVLRKILSDHDEIRGKFSDLKINMEAFKQNQDLDYKTQVLFPSYNLIATINHHAQREDKYIFDLTS
jgi:hemerythrin-like domain-containing protein